MQSGWEQCVTTTVTVAYFCVYLGLQEMLTVLQVV